MSLNALKLATQGLFPLTAAAAAVQGLLDDATAPAGGVARPRGAWFPYMPIHKGRPRRRRQEELIFLRP